MTTERDFVEVASLPAGWITGTMSPLELLGMAMHPQQQQVNTNRNEHPGSRLASSDSLLDDLMSCTWDDDDGAIVGVGDCELVFGSAGSSCLLEMDAFSSDDGDAECLSAAGSAGSQEAIPFMPFTITTDAVNDSHARAALPPTHSSKTRGKRAITAPIRAPNAKASQKPRMRRKLEIQLLRDESEQLQQKLLSVRGHWKRMSAAVEIGMRSVNADNSRSTCTNLARAESLWESLAVRQRDALTQSELENQNLKTQFQLQRKMLQRLRKLIKKRVSLANKMATEIAFMQRPNPQFAIVGCITTFHQLLMGSRSMFTEFGSIQSRFQVQGRDATKRVFREWAIKEDAGSNLHLEMVDSHVLPFDRARVSQALEQFYRVQIVDEKKCIGEFFQSSDDTVVRQYISSFSSSQDSGVVRVKEAIRSFVDPAQTVFVVNTILERLTDAGESSHRIHAQKWVLVRSWSSGSSSDGTRMPGTSIQSFYTLKPEAAAEHYRALWCKPMLEDILVPILDVGTTKTHQKLENALIEQDRAVAAQTKVDAC